MNDIFMKFLKSRIFLAVILIALIVAGAVLLLNAVTDNVNTASHPDYALKITTIKQDIIEIKVIRLDLKNKKNKEIARLNDIQQEIEKITNKIAKLNESLK
ncbi:MAG: hypothetical protein DRQ51_07510 [Gammaproteobacteria bacterium]|nr:MAG: hypothetical protein DRQ51_07510 [Gammaproteobacteria bacterium]